MDCGSVNVCLVHEEKTVQKDTKRLELSRKTVRQFNNIFEKRPCSTWIKNTSLIILHNISDNFFMRISSSENMKNHI